MWEVSSVIFSQDCNYYLPCGLSLFGEYRIIMLGDTKIQCKCIRTTPGVAMWQRKAQINCNYVLPCYASKTKKISKTYANKIAREDNGRKTSTAYKIDNFTVSDGHWTCL